MAPARTVGILMLLIPIASQVTGSERGAEMCRVAALSAAQKTGVPDEVLQALTLVETGRNLSGKLQPWPWAVNVEGKGYWFATRRAAVEFVSEKFNSGTRNFDVGCFQINYRWHGQSFESINHMFAPVSNALYAAKFLNSLRKEGRSWSFAAGAYHSRTAALATKYRSRFDRILANLESIAPTTNPRQLAASKPLWGSLASELLTIPSAPLLTSPAKALF